MPRTNRRPDELRPLTFERGYTGQAPGSVLVRSGRTTVLCTCCVELAVPPFLVGRAQGWLSAEYAMLPGSTSTRKPRDRGGKIDGRGVEIQRLNELRHPGDAQASRCRLRVPLDVAPEGRLSTWQTSRPPWLRRHGRGTGSGWRRPLASRTWAWPHLALHGKDGDRCRKWL